MNLSAMLAGMRRRGRVDTLPEAAQAGFHSASRSHVGRVRTINEDRVLDRPDAGLWAVIDGMGGHAAGDVAAEAALHALHALADAGQVDRATVEAALARVNADLHARGSEAGRVCGATAVVLLREGRGMTVLWVGDCRAYRLRNRALTPLTRDHSVVQELVDAGVLTPDQATVHPRAHVVTRALGAAPTVTIDAATIAIEPGDLFLLCSDGLGRAAPDLPALRRDRLDAAADDLLSAALDRDGNDNISLVLIAAGGG